MIVDCDGCVVRGTACDGCAVNALLQIDPQLSELDHREAEVIEIFARAGFEVTVLKAPATRRRGATRRSGTWYAA